jgi:hypothetical protein
MFSSPLFVASNYCAVDEAVAVDARIIEGAEK